MSEGTTTTTTAPVLTVPLNEDGTIGTLPEQLQKFLDGKIAQVAKRKPEPSPVETEELRQARAKLSEYEQAEAIRKGEYDKALQMRQDAYDAEKQKLQSELERRTARLKDSTKADIRAAAVEHGARKESLAELETLLSLRVVLDDDTLTPRVLGDDGKPSELTVPALVKAYLDSHPHHRSAPVAGGGARGGQSLSGVIPDGLHAELEAVKARVAAGSRNPADILRVQELANQIRQRG